MSGLTIAYAINPKKNAPKPNPHKMTPLTKPLLSGSHSHPHIKGTKYEIPTPVGNPIPYKRAKSVKVFANDEINTINIAMVDPTRRINLLGLFF